MNTAIIRYKTFKNSNEFEEWQLSGYYGIISIIPVLSNVSARQNENGTADADTTFDVFVTYKEIDIEPYSCDDVEEQ